MTARVRVGPQAAPRQRRHHTPNFYSAPDEARGLFAVALAAEPDNIEGMVDYAALLTATPALLAQDDKVAAADEWFRKALAKAPDDPRVLSMYAAFLAGTTDGSFQPAALQQLQRLGSVLGFTDDDLRQIIAEAG